MAAMKRKEDSLYSYLKIKLPKHVVMSLGGVEVVEWMLRDHIKGNFLDVKMHQQKNQGVNVKKWGGKRPGIRKLGEKIIPITLYNIPESIINEIGNNDFNTGRAIIRRVIYDYTNAIIAASRAWRKEHPEYVYNEATIRDEVKQQLAEQSIQRT